ncbi:hypothetical protein CFN16_06630 [Pseudomonas fluorescens]|uniref:DUF2442 domain-containing protein n=1 Tax=Pseudomonas fluorescens TaxID=294 RepID=A0A345UTM0_PSEFL|nr:DUF2442 domain-containing protein [Pseudomonas fluorescens]AXJ03822.1 hypothetical protein CFN16_06630 [Pseudomonas fluorescens]
MSPKKRPRLSAVQPLADFRLALTFIEGQQFIVDLSQDLKRYPGLKPLLDPEVFGAALIGVDGWSVDWPDPDIQIGADTLYLDALAQCANPHPASAAHIGH